MPIQTRRARQQNNEPLSPIDLDPWNSNIESIEEQRLRVAQQNQSTNNTSPLTTPPSTPPENNSNMSQQGSIYSNHPTIAFNTTPDGTIERTRSRTASGMIEHDRHNTSPSSPHSSHISSSYRSIHNSSNKSLPTTPRTPRRSPSSNQLLRPIDLFQREPSMKPAEEFRVQRFKEADVLNASGMNYFAWKKVMRVCLRNSGLLGIVDRSEPKPKEGRSAIEKWETKDRNAKTQLVMNMDMALYNQLEEDELQPSYCLWEEVNIRFEQNSAMARAGASQRLRTKPIKQGESMFNHIQALRVLRGELTNLGGKLDDEEWMSIIINSLATHPRWETARFAAGGFSKPEGFIGYLEMQDRAGYGNPLQPQTLQAPAIQQTEAALQTKNKTKKNQNDVCTNCKKRGHTFKDCWGAGGGSRSLVRRRRLGGPPSYVSYKALVCSKRWHFEKTKTTLFFNFLSLFLDRSLCNQSTFELLLLLNRNI